MPLKTLYHKRGLLFYESIAFAHSPGTYSYCPGELIDLKNRHPRIMTEIQTMDPDIVSMMVSTLVTASKRSLGEGNVFTRVCYSVHRGVRSPFRYPLGQRSFRQRPPEQRPTPHLDRDPPPSPLRQRPTPSPTLTETHPQY